MLDSYFFIPGDKDKFLSKIHEVNADYIVIDLEDAVSSNNKIDALHKVLAVSTKSNYFVRIPFDNSYSTSQITDLIQHFSGNIVIPKIENTSTLEYISECANQIKLNVIILIETPLGYINLLDILKKYATSIVGLGFGTHDFCSLMGIKHTYENIIQYKRDIIVKTKAFNIKFIDGVDLDLQDFNNFKNESKLAYNIGAEGKFLIHPKQLTVLHEIKFLNDDELAEVYDVYEQIKNIDQNDINVYVIDGKVYEKPHINRIKNLMNRIIKQKDI